MVSGTGRACAALIEAGRGVYVVKGVYAGAWPKKGYGIALKIEDGADKDGGAEASTPTRVLVVAQNADFRARVREELAAGGDSVEVLTAQTAEDALLMAKTAPPKRVIISISTPGVEGTDAISKLSKDLAVHQPHSVNPRAHRRHRARLATSGQALHAATV